MVNTRIGPSEFAGKSLGNSEQTLVEKYETEKENVRHLIGLKEQPVDL